MRWSRAMLSRYSYLADEMLFFFASVVLLISLTSSTAFSVECINSTVVRRVATSATQPSDIAVGPGGDSYLVDGVNNRILVFDRQGNQKFSFGRKGSGNGEFLFPLGIAIADEGTVFVADSGNRRIQVFDLKGNYLYRFAVSSGPGEKPADPVDVLVSPLNGYVYVADNENHKIKVYTREGAFAFEWGKFSEGNDGFRYPGLLAINQFNEVFVVDVLNTRVQKFTPFGEYIATIGTWGVLPGRLFRPKGVAVDKKDRVFVTDSYMGCVQVFTGLGGFLGVMCGGSQKRQFITPVGIAVDDRNGLLYVVEMKADRATVLTLSE